MCCYTCMPDGVQLTRGAFLAKIKEQRGGKCQRCGYNTCLKALEFHHLYILWQEEINLSLST